MGFMSMASEESLGMTTQVCKQCGRELDLAKGFYAHPHYATGRMKTCKKCHKANVAENCLLKREQYRARKRIWSAKPENVAKRKAYRESERGRALHRISCRVYARFKRLEARIGTAGQ
jgi:hypothetical protein